MWQQPLRFGGKSLQSLSEAKNCFREKHLKCKLRAVPSCRCQIAHNHYQTERDLTLDCTQQDRRQNTKSIWQVKLLLQPMIFQQGMQHHRCRSLTFVSTITPDCKRYEFRNTADIFSVSIRESMLNSFVSRKTFMVHSQNGKKSVSKDIFCSLSMKVDNNNKHQCRQCHQKPEHFPKVRITYRYTHSYKVPA